MRFAIQQRNKAKSERGRAQQKQPQPRFAMDTVVKSHCVATHKKMHQTNWLLPRKVKHAFLIFFLECGRCRAKGSVLT